MTEFRPPVRRLLIFFLLPIVALAAFIAVGPIPVAIRVSSVVLDVAGFGLLLQGLALRIQVDNGGVTVRRLLATKRFDAEASRVRMQINPGPIGGEAFQLVIKSDDGNVATHIPMILFAPRQATTVVDAVCTSLGV